MAAFCICAVKERRRVFHFVALWIHPPHDAIGLFRSPSESYMNRDELSVGAERELLGHLQGSIFHLWGEIKQVCKRKTKRISCGIFDRIPIAAVNIEFTYHLTFKSGAGALRMLRR